MFSHVITGVDGFDGGRDAIALTKALCSGRPTLVCAYPADPVRSQGGFARYAQLLRDETERLLEAARLAASVDAELLAVSETSPARALHRIAEERDAELIVVGSAHHGTLGRLLLGDVGRGVLHGAPCPVAIAPKRFRGTGPRRIAVGFDGSPEAHAALDLAARLASDRDAALTVFVAWEDPPIPVAEAALAFDQRDLQQEQRAWADALLAEALAVLPASTAGQVLHGRADFALADATENMDLVIVGSRGWGPARRITLGSTSDRLVHRASCPVLVIPRPADADRSSEGAASAATTAADSR